jgi:DNA-binding NtrC family response regulator
VTATNRNLKKEIEAGRFRDDLFYRLNVFPIHVPPLRDRRRDIPALADHFAVRACVELGVEARTISSLAQSTLAAYAWPGNIRELANVIERAVLLCDGVEILPAHLPTEIANAKSPESTEGPLRANERELIVKALKETHWNQSQAARELGISRDNLRYRIKKYNIAREEA